MTYLSKRPRSSKNSRYLFCCFCTACCCPGQAGSATGEAMLRAPSRAAQCALSVVGSASRRKEGARATAAPLLRALVDSATAAAGSRAAHVPDKGLQRRHVSNSSRRCGWATAVGIPGLGDDVEERSKDASASRQALEVSLELWNSTGGRAGRFRSTGRASALERQRAVGPRCNSSPAAVVLLSRHEKRTRDHECWLWSH